MIRMILVPTDFSECAGYALHAAALFARHFSATVRVIHCSRVPENWQPGDHQEHRAVPEMESLASDMRNRFPEVPLVCDTCEGRLVDIIRDYVDRHGVDLLCMGSHGASGKSEYFIGSNTQKVVRCVHRPVLVVKEPMTDLVLDKVVFASDFSAEEEGAFLQFKEIVKHFVPEIHLLMVRTSALFEGPPARGIEAMAHFLPLCAPLKGFTHVYQDFNVDQGIRSFSHAIGASLVGISNHQRHPLRRLLTGSNVEALINHSALPVLSIDYEA
ncbi:MAG: universal stress protein [Haliscomenobacter sp.]|nr:universal stress protein [Haliscomenobacter sp.]MBP9076169.1 universal stress protein [Haliscomenobacter sp.]MBP9873515.1 universal stress protein [Haliscomenobacter sp.]